MLSHLCCRSVWKLSHDLQSATAYGTHQPNICILIDVGTRPSTKSMYHLWKTFDLNSNVGGACGEIAAYKGKNWAGLLNPLGMALLSRARPRNNKFFLVKQSPLRISNTRSRIFWTNRPNHSSVTSVSWCDPTWHYRPI